MDQLNQGMYSSSLEFNNYSSSGISDLSKHTITGLPAFIQHCIASNEKALLLLHQLECDRLTDQQRLQQRITAHKTAVLENIHAHFNRLRAQADCVQRRNQQNINTARKKLEISQLRLHAALLSSYNAVERYHYSHHYRSDNDDDDDVFSYKHLYTVVEESAEAVSHVHTTACDLREGFILDFDEDMMYGKLYYGYDGTCNTSVNTRKFLDELSSYVETHRQGATAELLMNGIFDPTNTCANGESQQPSPCPEKPKESIRLKAKADIGNHVDSHGTRQTEDDKSKYAQIKPKLSGHPVMINGYNHKVSNDIGVCSKTQSNQNAELLEVEDKVANSSNSSGSVTVRVRAVQIPGCTYFLGTGANHLAVNQYGETMVVSYQHPQTSTELKLYDSDFQCIKSNRICDRLADITVLSDGSFAVAAGSDIIKFSRKGNELQKLLLKTQIQGAHGLAVEKDGRMFVLDRCTHDVYFINKDGNIVTSINQLHPNTPLQCPHSVLLHSNGNIFISDLRTIKIYSHCGKHLVNQYITKDGQFGKMCESYNGDIIIANHSSGRVFLLTAMGQFQSDLVINLHHATGLALNHHNQLMVLQSPLGMVTMYTFEKVKTL